jgi:hypothetical protein
METNKSIFRPAAVRRYAERSTAPVLPRHLAPRACFHLLSVFCLVLLAAWLAASTKVPVFVKGVAAEIEEGREPVNERVRLTVFFSQDVSHSLKPGQRVLLRSRAGREFVRGQILSVAHDALSADEVLRQYNFDVGATRHSASAAVAHVQLDSAYDPTSFKLAADSREAYVEIGLKPILSFPSVLLPLRPQAD